MCLHHQDWTIKNLCSQHSKCWHSRPACEYSEPAWCDTLPWCVLRITKALTKTKLKIQVNFGLQIPKTFQGIPHCSLPPGSKTGGNISMLDQQDLRKLQTPIRLERRCYTCTGVNCTWCGAKLRLGHMQTSVSLDGDAIRPNEPVRVVGNNME